MECTVTKRKQKIREKSVMHKRKEKCAECDEGKKTVKNAGRETESKLN